jgi:hypothetical protein
LDNEIARFHAQQRRAAGVEQEMDVLRYANVFHMRRRIHAFHMRRRYANVCHVRRRIHACHMRRRMHACHMRRRIHVLRYANVWGLFCFCTRSLLTPV